MAFLGDVGRAIQGSFQSIPAPTWRILRTALGGLDIQIPTPEGTIALISRDGLFVDRQGSGPDNNVHFWDMAPGNYIVSAIIGPGAGGVWHVVVTPSSYTVTRLGGGGVTGYIAVG
jgi:hypothetical protein